MQQLMKKVENVTLSAVYSIRGHSAIGRKAIGKKCCLKIKNKNKKVVLGHNLDYHH